MYMFETNKKIIYMLWHEMKGSRVRVTYLAGGFEWVWGLEWWPWMLDSKEGSQAVLGALDLKEKKKSKRDASSIRRRLKCGCSSESKEVSVWGFWVCSHKY